MIEHSIGINEFAAMIGAHHSDVSRAVSAGCIRAKSGPNARGTGSKILKLEDAKTIRAAVRCGIPWRVAAELIDRLRPFKGGVIILEGMTFEDANRGQAN